MEKLSLKPIARIKSDFPTKFGVPRQSGLTDLTASIIFEPEYRNFDALKGLEEYSHVWLIWHFSLSEKEGWSPTVRPPRLGGNLRKGVFATRSPFRPNPLGLSCVKLLEIKRSDEGPVLIISGADLVDGTPIFDIKPYVPFTDAHPEAAEGFTGSTKKYSLSVDADEKLLTVFPKEKRKALLEILSEDPRPGYQNDPERVYGFQFAGYEIKFSVKENVLTVTDIVKL